MVARARLRNGLERKFGVRERFACVARLRFLREVVDLRAARTVLGTGWWGKRAVTRRSGDAAADWVG